MSVTRAGGSAPAAGAACASELPRVCVLLATYDGEAWLDEQLASIQAQTGVQVAVIASDDGSGDGTPALLRRWSAALELTLLPPHPERFGSAHRNFLRLVRDAPLGDADYVALADQDDVWLPHKLARAVECLRTLPAEGYSSDVVAFWPDGRERLLRKSHPQRAHDHLFGSPGPGCTFVLPRAVFDRMRTWVRDEWPRLQAIWVHDWLFYAWVRATGGRWHIDDRPGMRYRQHGRNEIGANRGWRAALARWRHMRSGAYRRDILTIADVVGDRSPVVQAVRRLAVRDRLWLVLRARSLRRRAVDALLLTAFVCAMPRDAAHR